MTVPSMILGRKYKRETEEEELSLIRAQRNGRNLEQEIEELGDRIHKAFQT